MDSTLIHPHPSASKLPIKRKTPDPTRVPPFKFHRIWTEPDEIRFLQGLLDCASQRLAFPRDLRIFYDRFSNTMPQPYTRSQLSEKLRRLRKKFRSVSTRLDRGALDRSNLSAHDRALYELSERLWHPGYAAVSPFNGARNVGSGLVGVKVDYSPNLDLDDGNLFGGFCDGGVKLSEVNVEFEGGVEDERDLDFRSEDKVAEVAAKVVMGVFDECCEEVNRRRRGVMEGGESVSAESFEVRWRKQRIAELDALGSRLRLALEDSLGMN